MKISKVALIVVIIFSTLMCPLKSRASSDELAVLYNDAIGAFQKEEYRKAITIWEKILDIDSSQTPPQMMIKMALNKIREKTKHIEEAADTFIRKGEYEQARKKYLELLAHAPGEEEVTRKVERLDAVLEITRNGRGNSEADNLIRDAVTDYIMDYKGKPVLLKLIYAGQINNNSARAKIINNLIDMTSEEFRGIYSNIEVMAGMNLLEQYLRQGLEHIYNEEYLRAIDRCKNALTIDKDNTVAMMRLGSSYYALDKVDQAEYYWKEVLRLEPGNKDVKKFLNAIEKRKK